MPISIIKNHLGDETADHWKRTLYILFFAQLMTAVGFSSIFPFLPLYVEDLGTNTGLSIELLSGLVFSAQAFCMMVASPVWGALADRFGRKLMVQRAAFGGAALLFLMAFARTAEELVLLRAVQGLVTGVMPAANALVAAKTPKAKVGYAMGLMQTGMGTGIALGPMIGGFVADLFGYGAAFYVTAAMLLLSGVLVLFGVRENFVPIDRHKGRENGFLFEWKAVLATPGVKVTYGISFLTQLGRMLIIPFLPLFIQTILMDTTHLNTFTGLVTGISSATTTISAIYLGRLGDRIGHRRILILATFFAALIYLPQGMVTAGWQLLVLQALLGVALGGVIPMIGALLASYSHVGEEGAVYGLENSIRSGARSIAPLLGSGVAMWFGLRATFPATAVIFVLMGGFALARLPRFSKIEPTG
jgi:DHA1 family multidrug resistance protein-like MFS transporter